MRWQPGDESSDVEDRRGETSGGGGGMSGGLKLGLGGTVVVLVLSLATGRNFFALLGASPAGSGSAPTQQRDPGQPRAEDPEEKRDRQLVSFVLDDVQNTWAKLLPAAGRPYEHAKLVLFTDRVRSGCGNAESAMGPFYCPADHKVYIDLGFYKELKSRFGAPGEFAQAYVIAHEVGHHVQNLLGIDAKMRHLQQSHPEQENALSVRMELQADCLAGVWAHTTEQRNILEKGDIESGLGAAAAVGDDRLQKSATGRVNPETWTHGSSHQRVTWFTRGFQSGSIDSCDTFAAGAP